MTEHAPSWHQPSRLSPESRSKHASDSPRPTEAMIQEQISNDDVQGPGQELGTERPITGASVNESIVSTTDLPDHELAFLEKVSAKKNGELSVAAPIQTSFISRPLTAERPGSTSQPCLAFAKRHTILQPKDAQETNSSARPYQEQQGIEVTQPVGQLHSPAIDAVVEQDTSADGPEQQQQLEHAKVADIPTGRDRPSFAGIPSERPETPAAQTIMHGVPADIDQPFSFLGNIARTHDPARSEPVHGQGPTQVERTKKRYRPRRKRRVPHQVTWRPGGQENRNEVREGLGRTPVVTESLARPPLLQVPNNHDFHDASEYLQSPNQEPNPIGNIERVATNEVSQPAERDTDEQLKATEQAIVPAQEEIQPGLPEPVLEHNSVAPANIQEAEIERVEDLHPENVTNLILAEGHSNHHDILDDVEDSIEPQNNELSNSQDFAQDNSHTELSHQSPNTSAAQQEHMDSILHERSGPAHVHRVSKPRRKTRGVASPNTSFEPGSSSRFANTDRLMEAWQKSYVTEKLNFQRETASQAKHHEETTTALQHVIDMQKDSITEWKGKYEDLGRVVHRLKEGAKTNQRYITGLHKDFETFRKSMQSLQKQDKAALQSKLAEIEEEKLCLHRDLENTLHVLGKSQKNLKSTVNELYTKLALSENKGLALSSELVKLKVQHEDAKKQCQKLETQILTSTQSMQKQLSNESVALSAKLNEIQHTLNYPVRDEIRKRDMNECLGMLRQLQQTPFLTVKDCHKAEEKLRYVHEKFNNGFRLFRDLINGMQGFTRDNHQTLLNELQTVYGEVLKYEKIAEENINSHESNRMLHKQLQSQRSHCQLLEDQIRTHQHKEEEFRLGAARLKSDKKSATEAHQKDMLQWAKDRGHLSERLQFYEHDVTDIANHAASLQAQCLSHEQEKHNLLAQIESYERDIEQVNKELKAAQDQREAAENEASTNQGKFEKCKTELIAVVEKYNQRHTEVLSLRKDGEGKLGQALAELTSNHQNDIHRITVERDIAKEEALKHQKELQAAKEKIQMYNKRTVEVENELMRIRNEDDENGELLREANKTIAEERRSTSHELDDLKSQIRELQVEKANLGTTISQKHAAMESLRQAHDSEIAKAIEGERSRRVVLEREIDEARMASEELQRMLQEHNQFHPSQQNDSTNPDILDLLPSGPNVLANSMFTPADSYIQPVRKKVNRQQVMTTIRDRAMSQSISRLQSLDMTAPEPGTSQDSQLSWTPLEPGTPPEESQQRPGHDTLLSLVESYPSKRAEAPLHSDETSGLSSAASSHTMQELEKEQADLRQPLLQSQVMYREKHQSKKAAKKSRTEKRAYRTSGPITRTFSGQHTTAQPKSQANTSKLIHVSRTPGTPRNLHDTGVEDDVGEFPDFVRSGFPQPKHTYADHHLNHNIRTSEMQVSQPNGQGQTESTGEKRKGLDESSDGNEGFKRPRVRSSPQHQAGGHMPSPASAVSSRLQPRAGYIQSMQEKNVTSLPHTRDTSSSQPLAVTSSNPYHPSKSAGLRTLQKSNKYMETFNKARHFP